MSLRRQTAVAASKIIVHPFAVVDYRKNVNMMCVCSEIDIKIVNLPLFVHQKVSVFRQRKGFCFTARNESGSICAE